MAKDADAASPAKADGIFSPIVRLFKKVSAEPERLVFVAGALLSAAVGVVVGRETGTWDFGGPASYAVVSLAFSALAAGMKPGGPPAAAPIAGKPGSGERDYVTRLLASRFR